MNTNMIISIVYMVALFAIFYFLFIRPQRKKEKQLEELRSSLEVGQMVTTIGGMLATVAKVEEEFVVLEVGPNRTKMPFKKWAIASVEEKKENK
ncbi:MAG: preprotein translocase subunit YajC [Clostridiales bacterium]|uniref:preprotein translocase subunit YajC n=1 Tax=Terrisporobacter sp. TaxID=1965305 RepID=UPI002A458AE5|nr:preprotein translocase subunit YajC [Terrisporobacter sp.]MCI5630310.1 preprotein translocase subunit YajC [Clostridium sp.]MDD5879040.1 preprotein translocase subunit YajC [Clostridiales bacterium]MCI6458726.1 preprotein translocase subunit YajC [Clostridium sp.]MCI7204469.1 preprotein translocase subunit YajC [Clostridium sp.]MDD7754444.1 preprotein translocase subunit YajC [Clostridiales bacterium]